MKLDEISLPLLKSGKAGIIPYIVEDGKVKMIFMKSSDARYGGPDPMIAKGHVDEGENFAEAAVREGEEELGLKKSNMKTGPWLAWKGELSGMDARYPFHVFAVELEDKDDFGQFHYETESTHWMDAQEFAQKGRRSQHNIVQAVAQQIEDKQQVRESEELVILKKDPGDSKTFWTGINWMGTRKAAQPVKKSEVEKLEREWRTRTKQFPA